MMTIIPIPEPDDQVRFYHGWTTKNEINYIRTLATGSYSGQRIPMDAEEILRNYIRSATKRKKAETFGMVSPDKVIAFAEGCLDRISPGGS